MRRNAHRPATTVAAKAHQCYNAASVPGGMQMAGYRLYFMDRFSGHIEHRREFLADDDEQAIAIALGWSTGEPMELWLNSHKLKRWEAEAVGPD